MCALVAACSGAPPSDPNPDSDTVVPQQRRWERVTGYPCGVDSEGFVECWRSEEWNKFEDMRLAPIAPSEVPVDLLHASTAIVAWGTHRTTGESVILGCQGPTSEFGWCTPPPNRDYSEIGMFCGLHGGTIDCWNFYLGEFPDRTYTHLANVGSDELGAVGAGLADDNRVYFADAPEADSYAFPVDAQIATFVGYNVRHACGLTVEGEVLCVGPNPPTFDHPPYRMLSGGGMAVCAARQDWTIECADGSTWNFGPIRHMSALSRVTFERSDTFPVPEGGQVWRPRYPTVQDPPHLCVVTETNAIRCVGELYDYDDLQAALPAGAPD